MREKSLQATAEFAFGRYAFSRPLRKLPQKAQEGGIDLFCVRPGNSVRTSLDHGQASTFDELGGALSSGRKRNDAVVVAVNDEQGHVHTGQVLAEVFVPG